LEISRQLLPMTLVSTEGMTKSGKMSSSEPFSKIDFDDDAVIQSKIEKSFSVDKQVQKNGLITIIRFILFEKFMTHFII
jgi:hypothetical protein